MITLFTIVTFTNTFVAWGACLNELDKIGREKAKKP